VATANPLLNLAAQLGQNSPGVNTTVPGTFACETTLGRWHVVSLFPAQPNLIFFIDLIFKNQAMATRDKPQGQFVNDLLRTEFHKCVCSPRL